MIKQQRQPVGWLIRILASIVFCSVIFSAQADDDTLDVTIIDPFIDLHSGPGRGFPVVQVIERGEKITMLKKRTDWIKVKTRRGFEGWAHRNDLTLTLSDDGALIEFDQVDVDDYVGRHWNAGIAAGDFGGADALSAYVGYRFTDNLTFEGKVTHAMGNFSDSMSGGFSLIHETWPHWRVSPFFSLGVGMISTNPDATLVQTEDRTDTMLMVGVGAQAYITRRFMLRAEYTNNMILTSRDENEEVKEWKLGLNIFF